MRTLLDVIAGGWFVTATVLLFLLPIRGVHPACVFIPCNRLMHRLLVTACVLLFVSVYFQWIIDVHESLLRLVCNTGEIGLLLFVWCQGFLLTVNPKQAQLFDPHAPIRWRTSRRMTGTP